MDIATWLLVKQIILAVLAAYVLYLVVGALGPFFGSPSVGEAFRRQWQQRLAAYEAQTDCPDRAMLLEEHVAALDGRLTMIAQAKERLWLSTYFMAADHASRDLIAALYAAAERGVQVRVLYDAMMSPMHMHKHPMYYALSAHPKIEVRKYNPPNLLKPWTINGRLHDKLIVVDDALLLASGRNISDLYMGGYLAGAQKYDRDIVVYNSEAKKAQTSVVQQGAAYFELLWQAPASRPAFSRTLGRKQALARQEQSSLLAHYQALVARRPELSGAYDYLAHTYPCKRSLLLFGSVSIMRKEPQVFQQLLDLMARARRQVVLQTPYLVLSRKMERALREQAGRIDLDLYTNSIPGSANFFASADYLRTRKNIRTLGDLYEFQAAHSVHGKSLVLDGETAIVGSFNFDMRSAHLDTETMIAVECPEIARQLQANIGGAHLRPNHVAADGTYGDSPPYEPLHMPVWKRAVLPICTLIIWPLRFLA